MILLDVDFGIGIAYTNNNFNGKDKKMNVPYDDVPNNDEENFEYLENLEEEKLFQEWLEKENGTTSCLS